MADRIEVFKLDIDIDAAIKAGSEFKAQADALQKSLNDLKKSGDTSSKSYIEMKGAFDAVNAEYRVAQREVARLTTLQNNEINTVQEARNALSVVSSQWAKQAQLYGENSEQAQKLSKHKLQLTERLKELEKSTGDNTRNVGNYTDSMKQALSETNLFGKEITTVKKYTESFGKVFESLKNEIGDAYSQIKNAASATEGLSKAQKSAAVSINIASGALKLFRLALISTGIGAIVVAVGMLISYLNTTQEGIDKVTRVTRPLMEVFKELHNIVNALGGALAKAFSGDIRGAISDAKEAVSGFGDAMDEAWKRGQRLDQVLKGIQNTNLMIAASESGFKDALLEQNKIYRDRSKSAQERMDAAEQILEIEKAQSLQKQHLLRLQAEELKIALATSDKYEDRLAYMQAINTLAEEERKSDELEVAMLSRINNIRNQGQREAQAALAKQKEAQDEAIKANQELLNLFIAQQGFRRKSDQEELEAARKTRDQKIEILEQELEFKRISQEEYLKQSLDINNEFLKLERDLVVQNAKAETKSVVDELKKRRSDYEQYTKERLDFEINRSNDILEAEESFAQTRLDQGVINEEEYQRELEAIRADAREREQEAVEDWEEADKLRKLIDLDNQQAIDEERFLDDFEIRRTRLERMRQQEVEMAEKTGADIHLIQQKYAELEKKLNIEKDVARAESAADTFGGISELLGEHTAASKASAVAEAVMNTYAGVAQVWSAQSILPEPLATIQKLVSTGIVVGSGLKAASKIKSTQIPKAERGALFRIGGKRHAQGGTKFRGEDGTMFEAEKDELIGVMNRNAAAAFMAFNDAYPNGNSYPNHFAGGGIVDRITSGSGSTTISVPDPIDYDRMAEKIADANRELPAPQVAVTEINDGQTKFARVTDGAII